MKEDEYIKRSMKMQDKGLERVLKRQRADPFGLEIITEEHT